MKRCPRCNRGYTDPALNFCLEDGTPLVAAATTPAFDPNETIRYSNKSQPASGAPPQQQAPLLNQVEPSAQPRQWAPSPSAPPKKKSGAIWWVLGGLAILSIIGIGIVVMLIALASMSSNTNSNRNTNINFNSNTRVANRNANANLSNSNANTSNLPSSFEDDFSESNWGTGNFDYGEIWYKDEEYHMKSKERTYLVMYGPSSNYSSENATVRVTARNVEGDPSDTGFGLVVHGEKSTGGDLEDYALLIYPGNEPWYQIVKHKGGSQSTIVPRTKSSVIRTGTNTNQLEVRARGTELTFYINGQYVDRITDRDNFRRGVAGLYTSGESEVAFDDLEISR